MTKYKDFIETTGYKLPGGLCGFNCRHSFHPFDPKYDTPVYDEKELEEINSATVTLPNGKEISTYAAAQIQRKMERELREIKRECALAVVVNDTKLANTLKRAVRSKQNELKVFCDSTGLPRIYSRESVRG